MASGGRRRASTLAAAAFASLALVAVIFAARTSNHALRELLPGESLAGAANEASVRVLLITGGHNFEREPFLQVFRADPALELTHLEHSSEGADAWLRADLERVDAVVLYDMPP